MSDLLSHAQSQEAAALAIAIEVGLLATCVIHEDSIIAGHTDDVVAAYKIASARFKSGDPALKRWFSSQKELTDAIKEAVELHGEDECGSCTSAGTA